MLGRLVETWTAGLLPEFLSVSLGWAWEPVFLISVLWGWCWWSGITRWKSLLLVFLSLQYSSPSNPTDPYLPTAPKLGKKNFIHACVLLIFWKMENTFCSNSSHSPWQTRLTSFQLLLSLYPPTFILPVSFHFRLCTDGQDCVYVYTSPALLVYMYTFVFSFPPLNYKVLECLSL